MFWLGKMFGVFGGGGPSYPAWEERELANPDGSPTTWAPIYGLPPDYPPNQGKSAPSPRLVLVGYPSAPLSSEPQQRMQQQARHFWQKPGCGSSLAELGVGAAGTALTAGPLVAAPFFAPELFEGFEGLISLGKMGIVGVPGLVLMKRGALGVAGKCF